jgi:hypothetical protein
MRQRVLWTASLVLTRLQNAACGQGADDIEGAEAMSMRQRALGAASRVLARLQNAVCSHARWRDDGEFRTCIRCGQQRWW